MFFCLLACLPACLLAVSTASSSSSCPGEYLCLIFIATKEVGQRLENWARKCKKRTENTPSSNWITSTITHRSTLPCGLGLQYDAVVSFDLLVQGTINRGFSGSLHRFSKRLPQGAAKSVRTTPLNPKLRQRGVRHLLHGRLC